MPTQIESATMEVTRSSSSPVSAAKITAVTAEGMAAISSTMVRSIPVRFSAKATPNPRSSPPPMRIETPSIAKASVWRVTAALIESPKTRLAKGVVVR